MIQEIVKLLLIEILNKRFKTTIYILSDHTSCNINDNTYCYPTTMINNNLLHNIFLTSPIGEAAIKCVCMHVCMLNYNILK